jgi:23S rRNA pseudouridine1911/1915/1917 synthase
LLLKQTLKIPEEYCGKRLDQALALLMPEYSRSRLQSWIRDGQVLIDGQLSRSRHIVRGNESLEVEITVTDDPGDCQPENLPILVVFADEDLIVVDKSAGMVVHPAAGNYTGTLQNALIYHYPELISLPRGGIVHRLDKDTSGLMVIARSLRAHTSLVDQLQSRTMGREYEAIVNGVMVAGGTVDEPLGRHPVDRKRMAVVRNGKPAITHYRVIHKYHWHTHIRVMLETGRTHQIRVHMAHINYPLVGDPVYGGRRKIPAGAPAELISALDSFSRQALHAAQLELRHPHTSELMRWQSELPVDMLQLLDVLASHEA